MSSKKTPQETPSQETYIDPELQGDDNDTPPTETPAEKSLTLEEIKKNIEGSKKEDAKRQRYTTEQKSNILLYIENYDKEHGRGGASRAAAFLNISPISISQWKGKDGDEPKEKKTRPPKNSTAERQEPTVIINETALLKVLVSRGFKISRLRDELTGEIVKEEFDPQIKNLELKYSPIPANAEDGVYVIQTSPQPQFAMNLDTLIRVAKMKV